MGRPKRRRGGGRVTPKKSRPLHDDRRGADVVQVDGDYLYETQVQAEPPRSRPGSDFELELLSRDAAHLIAEVSSTDAPDLDEADYWASCIQSAVATRRHPDGVAASEILAHARRTGGSAGAVLAAAVAVYGPPGAASRARGVLSSIRDSCPEVPAWIDLLGEAESLRATRTTDRWGERSNVCIDYRRRDGTEHGVSVTVQPFCLGMAHDFSLGPPSTARTAAGREDDLVEDLSLADARAIVEAALLVRDGLGLHEDDDTSYEGADDDMRALLEQRLALLPEGGHAPAAPPIDADTAAGCIADFLEPGLRFGEHPNEIHNLGRTMLAFAMMCHDRDILRWTPPRVATFLEDWLADHGLFCNECGESHEHPPEQEWLATVESAFPRWLRYAAERRALPDDALEANLAAARESLKQMRLRATGSPVRLA